MRARATSQDTAPRSIRAASRARLASHPRHALWSESRAPGVRPRLPWTGSENTADVKGGCKPRLVRLRRALGIRRDRLSRDFAQRHVRCVYVARPHRAEFVSKALANRAPCCGQHESFSGRAPRSSSLPILSLVSRRPWTSARTRVIAAVARLSSTSGRRSKSAYGYLKA